MVRIGEFEARLVDAETKVPFKEHLHQGKVYFEVEPGAEYYVAFRKIQVSKTALLVTFHVDGKYLGYKRLCERRKVHDLFRYQGMWSRMNGVSAHRALMFVKAKFSGGTSHHVLGSEGGGPAPRMGQVRVEVHEAVFTGDIKDAKNRASKSFEAEPLVHHHQQTSSAVAKRKNLRSSAGSTTVFRGTVTGTRPEYRRGRHLYSIVLNYCAAVGLIGAGVLQKPPLWASHRAMYPNNAKTATATDVGRAVKAEVTKKRTSDGKLVEVIDLAVGEDDGVDECAVVQPKRARQEKDPVSIKIDF